MGNFKQVEISQLDLLRPVFNPAELRSMRAYNEFAEEHYQQIGEEIRLRLKIHKNLGPLMKKLSREEHFAQERISRQIQREAILLNHWDAYTDHLLSSGKNYALMGMKYRDWFDAVRVYKNCSMELVTQDDTINTLEVMKGLGIITDYALQVIGESYMTEMQSKVSEEQANKVKTAEKLDESESAFKALFDNSPDHIFMIDNNARIKFINHVTPGLKEEDVLGTHLLDFPHDDRKAVEDAIAFTLEKGLPTVYNTSLDLGESKAYYECSVAPIKEGERITGAVIIARDVSEKKKLQDEIQRLNYSLEEKVRNRTSDLEKSINELKGFSYAVSHDLRSPIRSIDGFAKILKSRIGHELEPKLLGYLQSIISNGERMGKLIDGLLEFHRLGNALVNRSKVDLKQLVMQVWQNHYTSANEDVQVTVDDTLPTMNLDRNMIHIAIREILQNSIKFRNQKMEKTRIKIKGQEEDESFILSINDNGIGFPQKYSDRIFHLFQRLHAINKFEGMGVGLALAKRAVEKNKGKISVYSTPNVGTTVNLLFPKSIIHSE